MTAPDRAPSLLPAELREKIDAYRDAVAAFEHGGKTTLLLAGIASARAALDDALVALCRDAERLDWIDDITHQYQKPEFVMYPDGTDTYWLFTGKKREGAYGRDVREAIDAARSALPSEKGTG